MWRAVLLGAVTGMRSQLPTALLAWRASRGDFPHEIDGPGGMFRRPGAVQLAAMAALGELVADKLPHTPNRLESGPFFGRLSLGAAAGAGISTAFGRSRIVGAALGVAGTALGSAAGHRLRTAAAERSGAPDLIWALAEDALAITLGLVATRAG